MDMRAICVFCGMGGGSCGLEAAGYNVVLVIDNSLDAKRAHEAFFPSVTVDTSDLTQVKFVDVLIAHGIDPLTFCGIILCSPPCQGLANCGKRNPYAATNDLLGVASQISSACPNAVILVENVRGLLALRNRPRLLELLTSFKKDGRDVPSVKELRENWVLDAQFYNVPQHRERVFIVAPPAWCDQISAPPQTTPVPSTLESVIGPESGFVDPDPRAISLTVPEAVCNFVPTNPWVQEYCKRLGKTLRPQRFDRSCATVTAHVGNRGRGRVALIHPTEPRLLSVGERMAAFRFPLDRGPIPATKVEAYRLIGNAIAGPVVEAIALRIKETLEELETNGRGTRDQEQLTCVYAGDNKSKNPCLDLVQSRSENKKSGGHGSGFEQVKRIRAVTSPFDLVASDTHDEHAKMVTNKFANLFDREHQITMIQSAIDAAQESRFENRFHCVLHGPPGGGKTDMLRSITNTFDKDEVLQLDATKTTQPGAVRLLLETAHPPSILIIEEIEKTEEQSLRWLLGLLDERAEIRTVNFRTGLATAKAKLLCLATANDIVKFDKLLAGALASRFAHRIYCPRPDRRVLEWILAREIKNVGGKLAWAAPALDHCLNSERTCDPRRVIAVCLSGRDKLLSGEYQKHLSATVEPRIRQSHI